MDIRQEALTHLGNMVLLGHFRGDLAGRDALVADFLISDATSESDGGRLVLADALAFAATVGVTMIAQVSGRSFDAVLTDLDEPGVRLLPPPAGMPWAEVKALVEAIPGGGNVSRAARLTDIPGALNATFGIAVAAIGDLARLIDRSPEALPISFLTKAPD